jgi:hypothetical protein
MHQSPQQSDGGPNDGLPVGHGNDPATQLVSIRNSLPLRLRPTPNSERRHSARRPATLAFAIPAVLPELPPPGTIEHISSFSYSKNGDFPMGPFAHLARLIIVKSKIKSYAAVLLAFASALLVAGCEGRDMAVNGVHLSNARTSESGLVIGQLKDDAVIGDRPCKHGWVQIDANGVPVGFTASREIDLGRFKIPADTWVIQNGDGVVTACAFPQDTEVQGHLCSGGGLLGGAEGIQTAFYPDGALKSYFLRADTRIQGIPCMATVFVPVDLYEDGGLKACALSEEIVRDGHTYPKGARLRFDSNGQAEVVGK